MGFTVIDGQIDGDVRIGGVEIGDDFLESGLRARVQVIEDDDQLACERAAGRQGSSRNGPARSFFILSSHKTASTCGR